MFGMALAGVVLASGPARGGPVFGGFDASRGGSYSLSDGPTAAGLRSLITADFAGSTITGSATLTSAYLSSINVLVIDSVYNPYGVGITGLSASEQAALLAFVKGGGSAILISDNESGFAAPANTYNSVFGVTVTGDLGGSAPGTITNQTSPIANGPFGIAQAFQGGYAGYFSDLGSDALSLGTYDSNGESGVAVINPGVLNAGSGAVVFFSDSFPIDDLGAADNQTLTLNALAFAANPGVVPEPSSLILCGVAGVVALAEFARRRPRAVRS